MIRLVKEISEKQKEWRNDPQIMKWTRGSQLLSEEDVNQWRRKIESDSSIEMFGIEINDSEGKIIVSIGTCGLTSISTLHRTAEFSLFIDPYWQNCGYGRNALIQLLTYGFLNLGLEVIWGETFESNPAWHLFETIGFQKEGMLRSRYYKFGKRVNSIVFSM